MSEKLGIKTASVGGLYLFTEFGAIVEVVENSFRMRQEIGFIDRHSCLHGNKDLDSCFRTFALS